MTRPHWPLSPEPLPPMSAAELRRFRKEELKCSQSGAGAALGVSVDTIRKWEQEKHPVPETAARLIALWRQCAGAPAP